MEKLEELLSRWEQTMLLEGISDHDRKVAVASCLETVRVQNESTESGTESIQLWKRLSIPIALRVFSSTNNLFYGENYDNLSEHRSNFQILKTKYNLSDENRMDNLYNSEELAKQAEEVAKFAAAVTLELNEIFRDMPQSSRINFNGFMPTKVGFIVYT